MPAAINLQGQRFGRLLVVKDVGRSMDNKILWRCQCECGRSTNVRSSYLRSGHTRSCGCLKVDIAPMNAPPKTHGAASNGHRWPEYRAWCGMKERCLNPKNKSYKHYGARGITVCERWIDSFKNFIADMGRRPSPEHSIDRINNDGPYDPANCRWATYKQQLSNQQRSYRYIPRGPYKQRQRIGDEHDF
jgi:hypothetical protein